MHNIYVELSEASLALFCFALQIKIPGPLKRDQRRYYHDAYIGIKSSLSDILMDTNIFIKTHAGTWQGFWLPMNVPKPFIQDMYPLDLCTTSSAGLAS